MTANHLTWVITRARHQATQWVTYFKQRNINYKLFPVLQIESLDSVEQRTFEIQLLAADYIIITSANCVQFASSDVIKVLKAAQHKIVTMGQGTSQALLSQTIQPFYTATDGMTSEKLLTLPFFMVNTIANKNILILSGAGGRDYLEQNLTARQAAVKKIALYQRKPVAIPLAKRQLYFSELSSQTPIFIMTSQEAVDALVTLAPANHQQWLYSQYVIAISDRIRKYAQTRGFRQVLNANSSKIEKIHLIGEGWIKG